MGLGMRSSMGFVAAVICCLLAGVAQAKVVSWFLVWTVRAVYFIFCTLWHKLVQTWRMLESLMCAFKGIVARVCVLFHPSAHAICCGVGNVHFKRFTWTWCPATIYCMETMDARGSNYGMKYPISTACAYHTRNYRVMNDRDTTHSSIISIFCVFLIYYLK